MAESPQFIGIGAQRAATTWLAYHLRAHPDVWMTPRKELHVFSRWPRYASPSHLKCDSPWRGALGLSSADRQWRHQLWRSARRSLGLIQQGQWRQARQEAAWQSHYLFDRPIDRSWYQSLFKQGEGKVCGEVTPAYALLEQQDVDQVAQWLPRVKIIFVVRNPLERGLSQLRLHLGRKWLANRNDEDELLQFLMGPMVNQRNDYLTTIRRWRRAIPEDRFHLAWYDDIAADPGEALDRIFRFLEVDISAGQPKKYLRDRINRFPDQPWPANLIRRYSQVLRPSMEALADALGSHAKQWLEACEKLANEASPPNHGPTQDQAPSISLD